MQLSNLFGIKVDMLFKWTCSWHLKCCMKILNLYVSSFGTNKRQRIWKTVKTVNSRLKTKGHKHFLDLWLKSIPVYKINSCRNNIRILKRTLKNYKLQLSTFIPWNSFVYRFFRKSWQYLSIKKIMN